MNHLINMFCHQQTKLSSVIVMTSESFLDVYIFVHVKQFHVVYVDISVQ